MKETPLSLCERASVTTALAAGRRLDNRKFLEVRDISINFGQDYGCCTAVVGLTRVLAQVSCEVVEPRPSRPNEGKLQINVHLSPMAAPHFEQGRGNELVDQLQQILDRNIKDSRCLDLESLCIMAEESVWQLRCDVTVLNAAGNLSDACNLAAVSALRHFHRPDVTVEEDGRVSIHTFAEMEPIATYMKKIPVCLTFAFFMEEDTYYTLLDPTDIEERVQSGRLIIGLNPHGEITSLIFPGRVSLEKEQIMNCILIAFAKAKATAEMIQDIVEEDLEKRKKKKVIKTAGFTKGLVSDANYIKNKYDQMSDQIDKIDLLVSSIRNKLAQGETQENMSMEDSDSDADEPLATGHYPPEEVRKEKAKEVSSFLAAIRKGTEVKDASNVNEECNENMEELEDYRSEDSNEEYEDVKEASTAANNENMEVLEDYRSDDSNEKHEDVKEASTAANKENMEVLEDYRSEDSNEKSEDVKKASTAANKENMEVLEDYRSEDSNEKYEDVKEASTTASKENMEVLEDYRSEESCEEQEDGQESTAANLIDSFLSGVRKESPSKVRDQVNENLESDSEEEEITEKLTSDDLG